MLKAIIFDLDGTLLDTLDDLTEALNYTFEKFGLTSFARDRVRRYVGNGIPKLVERALFFAETGRDPEDSDRPSDGRLLNACLSVFTEYYGDHSTDYTRAFEGVSELLAAIKELGLKTAIVTNKYDAAARNLKDIFFRSVDAIVGARDGIRPKPAPDGVETALAALGVDRADAVYVGDGETDMKTAKNCSMPAVAVTWGFRPREVLEAFEPEFIIDKPGELLPALRAAGLIA